MVAWDGRAALAELVDFALNEVAGGALEFERVGPGRSSAALPLGVT
jgi:hypothetical protein